MVHLGTFREETNRWLNNVNFADYYVISFFQIFDAVWKFAVWPEIDRVGKHDFLSIWPYCHSINIISRDGCPLFQTNVKIFKVVWQISQCRMSLFERSRHFLLKRFNFNGIALFVGDNDQLMLSVREKWQLGEDIFMGTGFNFNFLILSIEISNFELFQLLWSFDSQTAFHRIKRKWTLN